MRDVPFGRRFTRNLYAVYRVAIRSVGSVKNNKIAST